MNSYDFIIYKPKSIRDRYYTSVSSFKELKAEVGCLRAIISVIALLILDFDAITLYPYIIATKPIFDFLFRHEYVHILQQKEDGLFKFCVRYIWEFFKNFFFNKETRFDFEESYWNISYEVEARKFVESDA